MDIDQYVQEIDYIAAQVANDYDSDEIRTPIEPYYLNENMLSSILKMTDIKRNLITEDEKMRTNMIRCGVIDSLDVDLETKILLTSIYIEIWEKVCEIRFLQSMERYREDHPIFQNHDLYKHVREDGELINFSALKWGKIGCNCEYNGLFFVPDSFLSEEVIQFTRDYLPFAEKYIRLDPYRCSVKRPPFYLKEEALRPVNPNWINKLRLFKGQSTGGYYILQEPEIIPGTKISEEQRLKWWEYKIKGIRSLEIHAQRNNSGNLSMMIEEILDNPVCNGYYAAKSIHLDSDNNIGMQFGKAVLNHIDLAINVYTTEAFNERKKQSLANGRVLDASLRTHLLRFDGVPFRTLIDLSTLFFSSRVLTAEWISDQFG